MVVRSSSSQQHLRHQRYYQPYHTLMLLIATLLVCITGVTATVCTRMAPVTSVDIEILGGCTIMTTDLRFAADGNSPTAAQIYKYCADIEEVGGGIYYYGTGTQSPVVQFELLSLKKAGSILLQNMGYLTSIYFPHLQTVAGTITLHDFPVLKTLGMPRLETAGSISVRNLRTLVKLDIGSLVSVGDLRIVGIKEATLGATSLPLSQLQSVGQSLVIASWALLTNIDIPLLSTVEVANFSSLPQVRNISLPRVLAASQLIISVLPKLTVLEVPQLQMIQRDNGGLVISDTSLSSITMPLTSMITSCTIKHNPMLSSIGMDRLVTISDALVLQELPLIRNLDTLINLRTVGSLTISGNNLLENIDGLFHVRPDASTKLAISANPVLRSISGLCSLRGASGNINVPHISCMSITDIFLNKPSPTWTIPRDCNDTHAFDYTQMCNCQSLQSLQLPLCGRSDWACYNVTHEGDYMCHSVACQPLVNTYNYTVAVSNDGIWPSTANYTCRQGFASTDPLLRTCQFIDGSWDGYAPYCQDIDECQLPYPVCDPQSICFNTIGSWECSPYPVDGSLYSTHERAANITGGGVELLDNIGGQIVSFLVVRGRGDMSITLIKWTSTMFMDTSCTAITRTNIPDTPHALVTCTVDGNSGRGYHAILQFDSHGRAGMTQIPGTDRLNYPRAVFVANTLRLVDSATGTTSLILPSRESFNITFDVLHMGNRVHIRNDWRLHYGPWWSPRQYVCVIHIMTATSLTCVTQAEAYGNLLRLILPFGDILDDEAYSTDTLTYPASYAPRVLWIRGCTDVGNTTTECPTKGNLTMHLMVERRPKEPCQILIGGNPCELDGAVDNQFLTCILPVGAGKLVPIVIVEPGSVGEPNKLLSYSSPTITSIQGCDGGVNGNPMQVQGCSRTGGQKITINGQHFGAVGATVYVGTTSCLAMSQNITTPHTTAYCTLPPGVDTSSVLLLQDGGGVSTTSSSVVHAPCQPGQETNYTAIPTDTDPACQPCVPGMYSKRGEPCRLCDPLTIAPNYGQYNCTLCPAGRFERERLRCDACDPGQVAISGGCVTCTAGKYAAQQCEECPMGSHAAGAGSAKCDYCEAGKYSDATGRSQCTSCSVGRYNDHRNATACDTCRPGEIQSIEGQTMCMPCSQGTMEVGSISCIPCAAGSYQPDMGTTSCIDCVNGTVQAATGQTKCDLCAAGEQAVKTIGCAKCGVGHYSPHAGMSYCLACNNGTFQPAEGQSKCDSCPDGRRSSGGATCVPCPAGRYSTNMTEGCVDCPAGMFQSREGEGRCDDCNLGSWSKQGAIQCSSCVTGYSIQASLPGCLECRAGLRCTDGIATVLNDHWPWYVNVSRQLNDNTIVSYTELRVQQCSHQRCSHLSDDDDTVDDAAGGDKLYGRMCAAHRNQSANNVLCAYCAGGYSEWGPESSCIECREANGSYIVLVIIMSFVLVYVLHTLAQNTSGLPAIFFYFVQISVAMAPSSYISGVLSIFNMSVSSSGLCIAPLTATSQILLSLMMPFWLLAVLGVIAAFQAAANRVPWLQPCVHRWLWDWHSYQRTMVEMYMFSYSTVATTLVSYMVCTEAKDRMVIFDYPAVRCDDDNYRTGLVFIIIGFVTVVVLLPSVSLWFLHRRRKRLDEYRASCGTMFEAYRETKYFWQSIVVLRRSAFIALNLGLATRPSWRYLSFACLHGMSLVVHIFLHPYAVDILNRFESLTFITLATIAIVMNAFPDPERSSDPKYGINQSVLLTIITTLIMIPILVFASYAILRGYHRWCRSDVAVPDANVDDKGRDDLNKFNKAYRPRNGSLPADAPSVNNRDPLLPMKFVADHDA